MYVFIEIIVWCFSPCKPLQGCILRTFSLKLSFVFFFLSKWNDLTPSYLILVSSPLAYTWPTLKRTQIIYNLAWYSVLITVADRAEGNQEATGREIWVVPMDTTQSNLYMFKLLSESCCIYTFLQVSLRRRFVRPLLSAQTNSRLDPDTPTEPVDISG